jgi:cytochrome oxidase assembly protein ShyY1
MASAPLSSRFWAVARRPRWIAALLLCLGFAAGFAALGQWQLQRSVDNAHVADTPDTEDAVPLDSIAEPQTAVTPAQLGRTVTVEGDWVVADSVVLTDRNNGGSEHGAWLVGHLITVDGVTLVVALGWAPDGGAAEAARDALPGGVLTGRYLPGEPPSDSDFEAGQHSAISAAELINIWPDAQPAYAGYLIAADAPPGLERIFAPQPEREISLNVLNVFYAIEWVIFAGFAIYLWYRLVRDVVEREAEEATVE